MAGATYLRGLAGDVLAISLLRVSAAGGGYPLSVAALRGFEEAQRAIHIYSNDLPPRSVLKGEIARAYAQQIDAMLAEVARAFPDHLLIVVSPSGPVPQRVPDTPFALVRDFVIADDPGADDGFVLMEGAGIVHRERPAAAQVVDIVPTCLYAAGLPVGVDGGAGVS